MKLKIDALFVILLVCTCTSGFSQKNNTLKEIPDGNALVYFFRPSIRGFTAPFAFYCDTVKLGAIRANHYLYYFIPEGKYTFISQMGRKKFEEVDLELKTHETYYFRISGSANLKLITDQKKAIKYLRKCKNSNEEILLEEGIIKYK